MDGESLQSELVNPECPGCRALQRKVSQRESQVAQLKAIVEELRRAGKRQAGPFYKGKPNPKPKRPGRKPGNEYGTHSFRCGSSNAISIPSPSSNP